MKKFIYLAILFVFSVVLFPWASKHMLAGILLFEATKWVFGVSDQGLDVVKTSDSASASPAIARLSGKNSESSDSKAS